MDLQYVYAISNGQGQIKIGYSKNPEVRLKVFQIANPFTLKIIYQIPGDKEDESVLHKRFEKYQLNGEWFQVDGADVMAVMDTLLAIRTGTNVDRDDSKPEQGIPRTEIHPWSLVTSDSRRWHVFDNGTKLPAGTAELIGEGVWAVASHIIGLDSLPIVIIDGAFLRYGEGYWAPISRTGLCTQIQGLHENTDCETVIRKMESILKGRSKVFWKKESVQWVAFKDCSVSWDLENECLIGTSHNPAHRAEIRFDRDWIADPGCSSWEQALRGWGLG